MFPTTESPRIRTEQEEDRPRFSHEKQIVLNDLKRFAANFKLGAKVSPSEIPANDTGAINSVHYSSKKSRGGKGFFATSPVPAFTPLANGKAALSQVFGTNELLENIISFLPLKQLFDVKRVSKQWKSLVDNSPGIQEKLFIRRSNKESEFWVLKEARRLGLQPFGICRKCENYGVRLRFIRHIDSHPPTRICTVISVTLNPILQESCLAVTPDGTISHKNRLLPGPSVNYSAWVNALRYNEACIQNMFVTDPHCDTAYIEYLIIYFGNPKPALPYPDIDHNYRHHPRLDTLRVSVSGITVEARSGLRMRDILRAALRSRGTARCTLSDRTYCERRDTTMTRSSM